MGGRFGEILLLFILVLLLFGPSKLPDMAKSIGQAMNEFKKAANPESQPTQPQPALVAAKPASRRRRATHSRLKSGTKARKSR